MRFEPIPSPLPGMRMWGATVGQFHFVITHEDGATLKPEDRAAWVGYTASYKSYENRHAPAVRIDGLWQSLTAAEQACRDAWRQLKRKN